MESNKGALARASLGLAVTFALFGLNLGVLVGLLRTSLLTPLVPLLLAAGGGAAVQLARSRSVPDQRATLHMIGWTSAGCLLGVVATVYGSGMLAGPSY